MVVHEVAAPTPTDIRQKKAPGNAWVQRGEPQLDGSVRVDVNSVLDGSFRVDVISVRMDMTSSCVLLFVHYFIISHLHDVSYYCF